MTVTVPSTKVVHYNMQQMIANFGTNITAANSAGNYALAFQLAKQKAQLEAELVASLMADGALVGATILSTMTYGAPNSSGQGMV